MPTFSSKTSMFSQKSVPPATSTPLTTTATVAVLNPSKKQKGVVTVTTSSPVLPSHLKGSTAPPVLNHGQPATLISMPVPKSVPATGSLPYKTTTVTSLQVRENLIIAIFTIAFLFNLNQFIYIFITNTQITTQKSIYL